MSDTLYRKVGKRYQPVGYAHTGFPAEGVWLVTQGRGMRSERLFTRIGAAPSIMTLAAFERHRDAIAKAISIAQNWKLWSADMVAELIVKTVAEEEDKA